MVAFVSKQFDSEKMKNRTMHGIESTRRRRMDSNKYFSNKTIMSRMQVAISIVVTILSLSSSSNTTFHVHGSPHSDPIYHYRQNGQSQEVYPIKAQSIASNEFIAQDLIESSFSFGANDRNIKAAYSSGKDDHTGDEKCPIQLKLTSAQTLTGGGGSGMGIIGTPTIVSSSKHAAYSANKSNNKIAALTSFAEHVDMFKFDRGSRDDMDEIDFNHSGNDFLFPLLFEGSNFYGDPIVHDVDDDGYEELIAIDFDGRGIIVNLDSDNHNEKMFSVFQVPRLFVRKEWYNGTISDGEDNENSEETASHRRHGFDAEPFHSYFEWQSEWSQNRKEDLEKKEKRNRGDSALMSRSQRRKLLGIEKEPPFSTDNKAFADKQKASVEMEQINRDHPSPQTRVDDSNTGKNPSLSNNNHEFDEQKISYSIGREKAVHEDSNDKLDEQKISYSIGREKAVNEDSNDKIDEHKISYSIGREKVENEDHSLTDSTNIGKEDHPFDEVGVNVEESLISTGHNDKKHSGNEQPTEDHKLRDDERLLGNAALEGESGTEERKQQTEDQQYAEHLAENEGADGSEEFEQDDVWKYNDDEIMRSYDDMQIPDDHYYRDDYYAYQYNDDGYFDESNYIAIDPHVLSSPQISIVDSIPYVVVSVSYFFHESEYEHISDEKLPVPREDLNKYVSSGLLRYSFGSNRWTSEEHLDLSSIPKADKSDQQGVAFAYSSPTIADIDGDGSLEYIVGTSFGLLYVFSTYGSRKGGFPFQMGVSICFVYIMISRHDALKSITKLLISRRFMLK